jgi:hypothetical protein
MTIETALTIGNALGALASIGALLLAAVQSIRLRELRRRDSASLWDAVETARTIITNMEGSASTKKDTPVAKAYSGMTLLHRQLLRILALREPTFTVETVLGWKKSGKLRNEWQESEATKLVDA